MLIRALLALLLTASPTLAWEATSGRVCELQHDSQGASVLVTYDPASAEYAIAVTSTRGWENDRVFAMRFDGPRRNTITTDRHTLSEDGSTVTVTDSGFGNVLNGLEFNNIAVAVLGDQAVAVPLAGAAPAVQEFKACVAGIEV